jgi:hypothetical protein
LHSESIRAHPLDVALAAEGNDAGRVGNDVQLPDLGLPCKAKKTSSAYETRGAKEASAQPTFIFHNRSTPVIAMLLSNLVCLGLDHLQNALLALDEVFQVSDPAQRILSSVTDLQQLSLVQFKPA